MDTVYSAQRPSKAALLMLTERETREEIIIKLKNRKAETQEWVNNYPRPMFDYKTSEMLFRECLAELGISA